MMGRRATVTVPASFWGTYNILLTDVSEQESRAALPERGLPT